MSRGLILAGLAVCAGIGGGAGAEPYRPADADAIVERLPATPLLTTDRERAQRERLQRDPQRIDIAVATARAYMEQARASGDPRYEGYAQTALSVWWDAADAPGEVLLLRAALHERRHDFERALTDLDLLLAREPSHAQGWLARASILQVQGKYDESMRACARLRPAVGRLVRAACAAGAAGLREGGENALAELRAALRQAYRENIAIRAWGETVRGDIALAQGHEAEAEAAFRSGLRLSPNDFYLRAALADLLLDRGRNSQALELLPTDGATIDLMLRRARALPYDQERISVTARLEEIFDAARRRGDPPHLRSEAYFRLFVTGEAKRALPLATANFAAQREPFDARLLLEAALASGRPDSAQSAVRWVQQARVEHAALDALIRRIRKTTG